MAAIGQRRRELLERLKAKGEGSQGRVGVRPQSQIEKLGIGAVRGVTGPLDVLGLAVEPAYGTEGPGVAGTIGELVGSIAPYLLTELALARYVPLLRGRGLIPSATRAATGFGVIGFGREPQGEETRAGNAVRGALEGAIVGATAQASVPKAMLGGAAATAVPLALGGEVHSPVEITGNETADALIFNTALAGAFQVLQRRLSSDRPPPELDEAGAPGAAPPPPPRGPITDPQRLLGPRKFYQPPAPTEVVESVVKGWRERRVPARGPIRNVIDEVKMHLEEDPLYVPRPEVMAIPEVSEWYGRVRKLRSQVTMSEATADLVKEVETTNAAKFGPLYPTEVGATKPSRSEPPLSPGKVRLYRGEATPTTKLPDWISEGLRNSGALDAQGRWFTDRRDIAEWYAFDAGGGGRVRFVDVPSAAAEEFRVTKQPQALRFSRDPEREFFLPRELATLTQAEFTQPRLRQAKTTPIEPTKPTGSLVTLVRSADEQAILEAKASELKSSAKITAGRLIKVDDVTAESIPDGTVGFNKADGTINTAGLSVEAVDKLIDEATIAGDGGLAKTLGRTRAGLSGRGKKKGVVQKEHAPKRKTEAVASNVVEKARAVELSAEEQLIRRQEESMFGDAPTLDAMVDVTERRIIEVESGDILPGGLAYKSRKFVNDLDRIKQGRSGDVYSYSNMLKSMKAMRTPIVGVEGDKFKVAMPDETIQVLSKDEIVARIEASLPPTNAVPVHQGPDAPPIAQEYSTPGEANIVEAFKEAARVVRSIPEPSESVVLKAAEREAQTIQVARTGRFSPERGGTLFFEGDVAYFTDNVEFGGKRKNMFGAIKGKVLEITQESTGSPKPLTVDRDGIEAFLRKFRPEEFRAIENEFLGGKLWKGNVLLPDKEGKIATAYEHATDKLFANEIRKQGFDLARITPNEPSEPPTLFVPNESQPLVKVTRVTDPHNLGPGTGEGPGAQLAKGAKPGRTVELKPTTRNINKFLKERGIVGTYTRLPNRHKASFVKGEAAGKALDVDISPGGVVVKDHVTGKTTKYATMEEAARAVAANPNNEGPMRSADELRSLFRRRFAAAKNQHERNNIRKKYALYADYMDATPLRPGETPMDSLDSQINRRVPPTVDLDPPSAGGAGRINLPPDPPPTIPGGGPTISQTIPFEDVSSMGWRRYFEPMKFWSLELEKRSGGVIPAYTRVFAPLDEARQSMQVFLSGYYPDLVKAWKPFKSDAASRERITAYLEAPDKTAAIREHGISPSEVKAAGLLRGMYNKLWKELGYEENANLNRAPEFIENYVPWRRLNRELSERDALEMFYKGRAKPKSYIVGQELERETNGEWVRERDAFKLFHDYLFRGARKQFVAGPHAAAVKLVNELRMPSNAESTRKHLVNFVDRMWGTTDASNKALNDFVDGLFQRLGVHTDKQFKTDVVSMMLQLNVGAHMAWRAPLAIRNMFQVFFVYPMVGERAFAYGLKHALTAEGKAEAVKAKIVGPDPVPFGDEIFNPFGTLSQVVRSGLKAYAKVDDYTRVVAYHATRFKVQAAAEKYLANNWNIARFVKEAELESTFHPVEAKLIADMVKSGNIPGAAQRAGYLMQENTNFIYRAGNAPEAFRGVAGRLFGQFGMWPVSYIEYIRYLSTFGTPNQRAGKIARFIAINTAFGHAGTMLGVNTWKWLMFGPLVFTGGPMLQIAQDAGKVASALVQGRLDQDPEASMAEARLKRNLPGSFIPGFGFAKDVEATLEEAKYGAQPALTRMLLGQSPQANFSALPPSTRRRAIAARVRSQRPKPAPGQGEPR